MLEVDGARGARHLELAESLGLAMARRASDILERHRGAARSAAPPDAARRDPVQFAADDAIFTAVLEATSECLAEFGPSNPEDRWCDALLHLLHLAQLPAAAP